MIRQWHQCGGVYRNSTREKVQLYNELSLFNVFEYFALILFVFGYQYGKLNQNQFISDNRSDNLKRIISEVVNFCLDLCTFN